MAVRVPAGEAGHPPDSAVVEFVERIHARKMENNAEPKAKASDANVSPAIDGYYSMFVDEHDVNRQPHYCANIIPRFCYWYSTQMDVHPVLTKSITGSLTAMLGDIIAQVIEDHTGLRSDSTPGFHFMRIAAMFCTGLCYGPMLHYVYETMEHVLPIHCDELPIPCPNGFIGDVTSEDSIVEVDDKIVNYYTCDSTMFDTIFHSNYIISQRKFLNAFLHMALDQVFMAFPFTFVMMFFTGIMEGHWDELAEEFENDYITNVHALWVAALLGIGPIQMIAFRFLSLKWRTLAVNLLDVLEVAVMSVITHRNRDAPISE